MTKEEFIKKWNVAFDSKEQELEFEAEMAFDMDLIIAPFKRKIRESQHLIPQKESTMELSLFQKMLNWVEDDFNKNLFIDEYNKQFEQKESEGKNG